MTTKTEPTAHYARDFHRRLSANKHHKFVITVEETSHMPRMSLTSSLRGKAAIAGESCRIVGIYKGIEDLTAQDIADAIDAVDDFVPRAYRAAAAHKAALRDGVEV